jgi:coenzyme F420-0:L-glutamate ligase/coenzyme F420-1:gamma-L-glutamate ligase
VSAGISVLPLEGIPELAEGDDLAALLAEAAAPHGGLEDADIVVVAQKAISKVEGRVVLLDDVEPRELARELAVGDRDPRQVEVVLREAARLRERLHDKTGADVGVVVSDSFGRPWRQGTTDVALGVAGLTPLVDLRGTRDRAGYELHATQIAVADELAGAAELVLGKTRGVPAAVVRGLDLRGEGSGQNLLMPAERDLFR